MSAVRSRFIAPLVALALVSGGVMAPAGEARAGVIEGASIALTSVCTVAALSDIDKALNGLLNIENALGQDKKIGRYKRALMHFYIWGEENKDPRSGVLKALACDKGTEIVAAFTHPGIARGLADNPATRAILASRAVLELLATGPAHRAPAKIALPAEKILATEPGQGLNPNLPANTRYPLTTSFTQRLAAVDILAKDGYAQSARLTPEQHQYLSDRLNVIRGAAPRRTKARITRWQATLDQAQTRKAIVSALTAERYPAGRPPADGQTSYFATRNGNVLTSGPIEAANYDRFLSGFEPVPAKSADHFQPETQARNNPASRSFRLDGQSVWLFQHNPCGAGQEKDAPISCQDFKRYVQDIRQGKDPSPIIAGKDVPSNKATDQKIVRELNL